MLCPLSDLTILISILHHQHLIEFDIKIFFQFFPTRSKVIMSTDRSDPSMELTVPFSLTKTIHRQVPDSLQPEKHENRQDGKIVVITGGGTGIGAVSLSLETHE